MTEEPDGRGVRTTTRGATRIVELDRRERRNAVMQEDRPALVAALEEADRDPQVRVVVVTGHGEHFCAGGDIREFTVRRDRSEALHYSLSNDQAVFRALRSMSTPTIARVRGVAAGAGMYTALGCDIVIADTTAYFYPAQVTLAVIPDWGAIWLMPRLVGMARAKAALLTGDKIAAAKAAEWGLIAECVEPDELDAVVDRYCERIAALAALPVELTRRGLDESVDRSLDAFLRWEAEATADVLTSSEHHERVDEFLERRAAARQGRPG